MISIYFLHILTRPYRTPIIREELSLNASWFSLARTKKKGIVDSEKNTKNFIVNNDNIIRVWYLCSKWSVCRSLVSQTNGGTSRTKLSTLLKTNIFKYCALFCNKRNFFNSNNRQNVFLSFFGTFSLLTGEQN